MKGIKEKNELIAKFMEYEFVVIGYFGTKTETIWQRKNEKWWEKYGTESVGKYWINKKTKHIIQLPYEKLNYHKSWSSLIPVLLKIGKLNKQEYVHTIFSMVGASTIGYVKDIKETHEACYMFLVKYHSSNSNYM
jgi:hypothetical protein